MKKINYVLLLFLSFIIFNNNVLAQNNNVVDFSKKGKVDITLTKKDDNTGIKGAEITLYKVANATEENNNLVFKYSNGFEGCKASLSNLESKTLTSEIINCLNDNVKGINLTTTANGNVSFKELDLGLYLVKQTKKVKGYLEISPYLIALPKDNNNTWTYSISSKPKTEITELIDISVQKIWNTKISNQNDKNILPSKVTIELYKENELIDTVTLNEDNNWYYTWLDMEKSDEYIVKEVNIPKGYTATYQQEDNLFIVTNTTSLVQTGQMTWLVAVIGLLGMIFIVSSYIISKRTNNE